MSDDDGGASNATLSDIAERLAALRDPSSDTAAVATSLRPVDPDTGEPLSGGLDGLWTLRPWLTHLRDAAYAGDASPPLGLLAACLAVTGAAIHHRYRIRLGPAHPLSDFWLLLGAPGSGKSAAIAEMRTLLGDVYGHVTTITPSSGEGVMKRLIGSPTLSERAAAKAEEQRALAAAKAGDPYVTSLSDAPVVRHPRGLLTYDEGDLLRALRGRTGQSLPATLRSAWTGAELATDTGDPDRQRRVPAGEYSLSAVVGVQPALADDLLRDDGLGDRERWLVLPVTWSARPRVDQLPEHPGVLDVPLLRALTVAPLQSGECAVRIDDHVRWQALIDRRLLAGDASGEGDDYDDARRALLAHIDHGQHTVSHRLRLSGQISALDGRGRDITVWYISRESWWLAGVLLSLSAQARDHAATVARYAAQQRRHHARMAAAGDAEHAESAALERAETRTERIVTAVATSIARRALRDQTLSRSTIARCIGSRARTAASLGLSRTDLLVQAVDHALTQRWIAGGLWDDLDGTGERCVEWTVGESPLEMSTD